MRKEVYLEQEKKNSAAKVRRKQKALKRERKDLKQSKGKAKRKSGLFDLIFKKEEKRYTVEDTIPYLRLLKAGYASLTKNISARA